MNLRRWFLLWDWRRALLHMPVGWLAVGCDHLGYAYGSKDFGIVTAIVMGVFLVYEWMEAVHLADQERNKAQLEEGQSKSPPEKRRHWRPNRLDDSFVDVQGALVGLVTALLVRGICLAVL